jgi:hypothetical protein
MEPLRAVAVATDVSVLLLVLPRRLARSVIEADDKASALNFFIRRSLLLVPHYTRLRLVSHQTSHILSLKKPTRMRHEVSEVWIPFLLP